MGLTNDPKAPVVWARKHVAATSCPKSLVTAESETLVEDFLVRRQLGGIGFEQLSARQVEAFLILERELMAERNDGEHSTRRDLSKIS